MGDEPELTPEQLEAFREAWRRHIEAGGHKFEPPQKFTAEQFEARYALWRLLPAAALITGILIFAAMVTVLRYLGAV